MVQLRKHSARIHNLELRSARAAALAKTYSHLSQLLEQRRLAINAQLTESRNAEARLKDAPSIGFAAVMRDHIDAFGRAVRFDSIVKYGRNELPKTEAQALEPDFSKLLQRQAEMSDEVRLVTAMLAAVANNPFSAIGTDFGKMWSQYGRTSKTLKTAFEHLETDVGSRAEAAIAARATAKARADTAKNESLLHALIEP